MKLGKIINALPALQKLAGEDLTIKTLYRVSKLMQRLEKEIDFFNAERNKTIEELCVKEKGAQYKIPEENREALDKRLEDLSNVDIEPEIEPTKISSDENMRLSYNDLKALEGLVLIYDIKKQDGSAIFFRKDRYYENFAGNQPRLCA